LKDYKYVQADSETLEQKILAAIVMVIILLTMVVI